MSFSCFHRWWLSGTKATNRSDMTGYPEDGVFLEKKSPWQKRDWIWCWMICFQGRGSCAIRQEYRWSSMSTLRWEKISAHVSEQCWKSCTLFRVWKGISGCGIWLIDSAGLGKSLTGCEIWLKDSPRFGKTLTGCGIWPKDRAGFGKSLTGCDIWLKDSARFGKTLTDGMRDVTKRQGGIRENVDGMRDLTKRQCGIRENVDRCGIWLIAGKRNLPKGTDADWERKWCLGMAMAEVRDVLFSWKWSRNAGSGIPVSRS